MSELPSIFDARGAFQELPDDVVASLDDGHRATYAKIRQCAADLKVADTAVADAIEQIKTSYDDVTKLEKFMAAIPQPTYLDLWRESKATRRAERGI